jgi:serine/threonine protein phosphatase PrpC
LTGEQADAMTGPSAFSPAGPGVVGVDAPTHLTAVTRPAAVAAKALTARPCRACGGSFGEGWCMNCGAKQPRTRDHVELEPAGWVAGVCDRGMRHTSNEDAIAVAVGPGTGPAGVLVVCDGVSSSENAAEASLAAAHVACEALVACAPSYSDPISTKILFWTGQIHSAAQAAQRAAVGAAQVVHQGNPPSCTFAAAVSDGPLIVAGWVGDSRIYWLPDGGPPIQLSVDHSWLAEEVARGVPHHVAESNDMAHAITRWLGADSPDPRPVCATAMIESPGWLLVCTDGLWNYCSKPADLDALVSAAAENSGGRPMDVARALVDWANRSGGHDNVSVALARLPVPRSQAPTPAVASSLTGSG